MPAQWYRGAYALPEWHVLPDKLEHSHALRLLLPRRLGEPAHVLRVCINEPLPVGDRVAVGDRDRLLYGVALPVHPNAVRARVALAHNERRRHRVGRAVEVELGLRVCIRLGLALGIGSSVVLRERLAVAL